MRAVAPIALLLCLPLLTSSCVVVSLQPVYDDSSVVFDQALVGNWVNAEEETSVAIERAEWRSYKVAYTDRFATRNFHGNLTRIGDATWLDLTEVRGEEGGPFLLPEDQTQAVMSEWVLGLRLDRQPRVPLCLLDLPFPEQSDRQFYMGFDVVRICAEQLVVIRHIRLLHAG